MYITKSSYSIITEFLSGNFFGILIDCKIRIMNNFNKNIFLIIHRSILIVFLKSRLSFTATVKLRTIGTFIKKYDNFLKFFFVTLL